MQAAEISWIYGFILMTACMLQVNADPVPEPAQNPAKAHRSAYFNEPANPRFRSVALPLDIDEDAVAELRQADDHADANEDDSAAAVELVKDDASSGRLFMKKFLLFKNIFGASTQQPVIPIIITGAGNTGATATANPTQTVTSTATIPTATGTITTSPAGRGDEGEAPEPVDVQALQAALAANAAEYVVTDQDIKGTTDSKSTNQPQNVNLRPKGGKRGQFITVRIPPQYRRYFKSGQKVMLNTGKGNGKRRVVKRRNNKNRKRVNRNRNRLVPIA